MASIKFCGECNNLLYPKEDKVNHVLLYACRNCQFEEETHNACVFKHDLLVVAREEAGVTQDLETDPTLPRSNIECPYCKHKEAVFFQGQQAKRNDTKMTLFYVCTNPQCHRTFKDPKVFPIKKKAGGAVSLGDDHGAGGRAGIAYVDDDDLDLI